MTITPVERRLIETAADVQQDTPERADFLHAILCQVGMPRKRTEARVFERACGRVMLRLEAGPLFDGRQFIEQPLPYGVKPRLIMAHICGEAVRTRSREIEIGHSAHEFMKLLGFDTNGPNYTRTRTQIAALAACRLTLGYAAGGKAKTINTQPIEQFEAWLHPTGEQAVLWPGRVTLSGTFFDTILEHPVPLERAALTALKHSALALDVYTWLAHRLCRIAKSEGVKVSWENLRDQFGQEYINPKDFKKELHQSLRQVLTVYPAARVEKVPGGLLLKPSAPPVAKISVQTSLSVTSG